MLALKLLLVPAFLLLISLAGRRWGPAVAGWLAGLPVLTGPILFLLTLEHGPRFAAAAATVSLSAVAAAVVFILTYARVCAHRSARACRACESDGVRNNGTGSKCLIAPVNDVYYKLVAPRGAARK